MKLTTNQIILGVAVLSVVIFTSQSGDKKESPAGAIVSRSLPATAQPGADTTITVSVTGVTGSYFVILRETIPIGWTYVSGGQLESSQVKGIASTLTGNILSFVLKAPSTPGTHTFSGTYQFSGDATPKSIEADQVIVGSGGGNGGNGGTSGGSSSGFGSIGLIVGIVIGAFILYRFNKK